MRLLLIQSVISGPWTWCVLDKTRRVIARSPDEYKTSGRARSAGTATLKAIQLAAERGWTECPSVQLPLEFPPHDEVVHERREN